MRRFRFARLRLWWERAFWVVPTLGVLVGYLLHRVVSELDAELTGPRVEVPSEIAGASAAQLFSAIGGGMVTFTGLVFSFVVLLLQFGSSQYSPRTVSYFLRARLTQTILATFLATITFSFLGLLEVGSFGRTDYTPELTVVVAVGLLLLSLGAFILLLHSVGRRVSVDAVLSSIGRQARGQLRRRLLLPTGAELEDAGAPHPHSEGLLVRSRKAGQIIGIEPESLLRTARHQGLRVELLVQVGDAVSVGSPLLLVEPSGRPPSSRALRALGRAVVVDKERSLRYDAFYSLRILVDVAVRALSPGINDPTTAVRAIDEIEGVLRAAAGQRLGPQRLRAEGAEVLVLAPGWPGVVHLALLEIVLCAGGQPQVSRRLTALIDGLVADLPDDRDVPLLALRSDLEQLARDHYPNARLHEIALGRDRQGLGGAVTPPRTEPLAPGESPAPPVRDSLA